MKPPAAFFRPQSGVRLKPSGPASVWGAYRRLDRSQWLSRDALEALQLARLRLLLEHCRAHTAYYRQALAEAGVEPQQLRRYEDLRRLPLLRRETCLAQAAQLVARTLPAGTVPVGALSTSGTMGVPVVAHQTNVTQTVWLALTLRDLEWGGVDPRGRLAAIRPSGQTGARLQQTLVGVDLPTWGERLARVVQTGPSHILDIHADPLRQWAWLRRVDPDYLLSYPSNLAHLAELAREAGERLPRLRAIQSIAEVLDADVRRRIESAFGVPAIDTYSCCEGGYVASPCPEGHGLHVHAESVIVEVLDAADRPCLPGETGRVVLTALHNAASPFVRYEIQDEAIAGPERCPCGRGLPLLLRVLGKRRPMYLLPGGRAKLSTEIAVGIRRIGGFRQFQTIQQAPDHLVVQIVPGPSWDDRREQAVIALAHEFFETPIRVEIQRVSHLPRSPRGKLP